MNQFMMIYELCFVSSLAGLPVLLYFSISGALTLEGISTSVVECMPREEIFVVECMPVVALSVVEIMSFGRLLVCLLSIACRSLVCQLSNT